LMPQPRFFPGWNGPPPSSSDGPNPVKIPF
jgi:hypothetical protein